ncbi:HNH endonuclease [Bacillus subtilis]|nr:HNH endonuclease signature motif containing protein [Bacillus subtilis]
MSLVEDEKKSAYQFYDKYKRNQTSKVFYNSYSWKKVRDRKKHESFNLCKHCLDRGVITAADVCDHIIPIEIRWDLRLTYSNLQMLCHGCHNRKTREDEKKYGK